VWSFPLVAADGTPSRVEIMSPLGSWGATNIEGDVSSHRLDVCCVGCVVIARLWSHGSLDRRIVAKMLRYAGRSERKQSQTVIKRRQAERGDVRQCWGDIHTTIVIASVLETFAKVCVYIANTSSTSSLHVPSTVDRRPWPRLQLDSELSMKQHIPKCLRRAFITCIVFVRSVDALAAKSRLVSSRHW